MFMSIIECIDDYFKNVSPCSPVFTNDIYIYVNEKIGNVDKALFNLNMQRYEKRNKNLTRYKRGVYYKSVTTPFGTVGIDMTELIKRTYLVNSDKIIGYESGPSYMNKIGLTTQMPSLTYIVTNKAKYSTEDKARGVYCLKPVTNINSENFRYLQFLDMLDNRLQVSLDVENYIEILRKHIITYNLSFERLVGYAKYYNNNNVYLRLSELARGVN
jgi:hypothetical protein